MRIRLIAITLSSIAASCCTIAPPELAEDTPASATMPEIDINALGVPFASVPDAGLLCAGQISPEPMDALPKSEEVGLTPQARSTLSPPREEATLDGAPLP